MGWTFTPNPVTSVSHAIQGRAWGIRASIVRLVNVTLTLAIRLCRVVGMFLGTGLGDAGDRRPNQQNQRRQSGRAPRGGDGGTRLNPGRNTGRRARFVAQIGA